VASAAAVPLTELKSIARMAITRNFLREPSSGRLGHSAISAAFIENVSLSDWAIFVATTSAGVASKIVEATEKFGTTDSKTETSYNIWRNTDKPFFDDLKESKERTAQFAGYMRNVTSGQGTKIEHLVSGYDWASLGSATVIDVRILDIEVN
jgi:6-hydroxytryprostatin B O-methyltransferase